MPTLGAPFPGPTLFRWSPLSEQLILDARWKDMLRQIKHRYKRHSNWTPTRLKGCRRL